MIGFSAQGTYLLLVLQGSALIRVWQGTYSGQDAYFFFEKQSNVQYKTWRVDHSFEGIIIIMYSNGHNSCGKLRWRPLFLQCGIMYVSS